MKSISRLRPCLKRSCGLLAKPDLARIRRASITAPSRSSPTASFEVTTLRRDVETDGRHAVVAFTTIWQDDAARRDFTINALYCREDGTLYDPVGGLDDLRKRRVRFIGDAEERIREDYLRILSFFRFSAAYGNGQLDPTGLAAAVALKDGLSRLSPERVRAEILKSARGTECGGSRACHARKRRAAVGIPTTTPIPNGSLGCRLSNALSASPRMRSPGSPRLPSMSRHRRSPCAALAAIERRSRGPSEGCHYRPSTRSGDA